MRDPKAGRRGLRGVVAQRHAASSNLARALTVAMVAVWRSCQPCSGSAAAPRRLSTYDRPMRAGTVPRRPDSAPRPLPRGATLSFIHIPKTAGSSFLEDAPSHLPEGAFLQGNRERPWECTRAKHPNRLAATLLRHPWKHVLSQFLECKFAPWGRRVTHGTAFPGGRGEEGRQQADEQATAGFGRWLDHFLARGDGAEFADPARHAFGCYNPWNLQSRYLAAPCAEDFHAHHLLSEGLRVPDAEAAAAAAEERMAFVGIADLYVPSLCLLRLQATGAVPSACGCDARRERRRRSGAPGEEEEEEEDAIPVQNISHGVPQHRIEDLPLGTLVRVGRLVQADTRLFLRALAAFEERATAASREAGVELLCDGEAEAVRRDVQRLMELSEGGQL